MKDNSPLQIIKYLRKEIQTRPSLQRKNSTASLMSLAPNPFESGSFSYELHRNQLSLRFPYVFWEEMCLELEKHAWNVWWWKFIVSSFLTCWYCVNFTFFYFLCFHHSFFTKEIEILECQTKLLLYFSFCTDWLTPLAMSKIVWTFQIFFFN